MIKIDIKSQCKVYDRAVFKCIGSCRAYLALREDYREHLRLVQKEIGFEYIRFHGIFGNDVGIYNEYPEGNIWYNFQNTDKIFDFLLDTNIKPFVEFGFMPEALASGQETIFHYKGNITPPKDIEKWRNLIKATVIHWIDRYGINEVLTWRFEVWNEPDLIYFWTGGIQGYFELYKATAEVLKEIHPNLMVGGPATSGNAWISDMLDYCENNEIPIDFISTHMYATDTGLDLDGKTSTIFTSPKSFALLAKETADKVRNSKIKNLEVHYTEWNVSPSHMDSYGKDSEFNAVFVLQTVFEMQNKVDSFSYWTFSDIFEESGMGLTPFSGKYGLINMHGIKKPVFHAFKYLKNMFEEEILTEKTNLRFTKSKYENYRMLLWNIPKVKKANFEGGEWLIDGELLNESISINGLNGMYSIKAYKVDITNGNAYRAWKNIGEPQYLNKSQINNLEIASQPKIVVSEVVKCNGNLNLNQILEPCSFVYFEIDKI